MYIHIYTHTYRNQIWYRWIQRPGVLIQRAAQEGGYTPDGDDQRDPQAQELAGRREAVMEKQGVVFTVGSHLEYTHEHNCYINPICDSWF